MTNSKEKVIILGFLARERAREESSTVASMFYKN
jgi:hypothetical protein